MKTETYFSPSIVIEMIPVEAGSEVSGASDNEYGAGAGKLEYDVW
ncbi:MAG: hypothetical protein SOZ21_07615 [Candidatus Cryptobacteroides sp.]|nr:hypothetical protein [Candidatus Cryptobacteroides sp.]